MPRAVPPKRSYSNSNTSTFLSNTYNLTERPADDGRMKAQVTVEEERVADPVREVQAAQVAKDEVMKNTLKTGWIGWSA